ncbi:JAB domain-containing protein [Sphingobium sp. AN558]|uniref:JAB domain-containing protein n=1 Tax=Sphingobium sp. AN558 TaxID=3133442 RepID=UPI0030C4E95C
MAELRNEELRIIFFNDKRDGILGETVISGTASEVSMHCKDLVRHAFSLDSSAILLAHNHPSGNPQPSTQDVHFTRSIVSVCKALEITVLDHIVIAAADTCSFREMGIM